MKGITEKEMLFVLSIFKSPEKEYSASSISPMLNISRMGALKIARKLEKDEILGSKTVGKSRVYFLNFSKEYAKHYLRMLLSREAEKAAPYIRVWINEIKKIKNAEAAVLFGSILRKKEANDIDVLFVARQNKFEELKKEIEKINKLSIKKIHPIYQSENDFKKNLYKRDKLIIEAIKGIFIMGEDKLMGLISER